MAQAPLAGTVLSGAMITGTGTKNMPNITAPVVVKATAGRVVKVVVLGVVGTGGALTINDCSTLGAASAANQIYTMAGTIAVGTIVNLDFPMLNGIVISAVPTGGTPQFAVAYV